MGWPLPVEVEDIGGREEGTPPPAAAGMDEELGPVDGFLSCGEDKKYLSHTTPSDNSLGHIPSSCDLYVDEDFYILLHTTGMGVRPTMGWS